MLLTYVSILLCVCVCVCVVGVVVAVSLKCAVLSLGRWYSAWAFWMSGLKLCVCVFHQSSVFISQKIVCVLYSHWAGDFGVFFLSDERIY